MTKLIRIPSPDDSTHDSFVTPPEGMAYPVQVVDHAIRLVKVAFPHYQWIDLEGILKALGFEVCDVVFSVETF